LTTYETGNEAGVPDELLWLNLGCGKFPMDGYVNVDMHEDDADITGDFMEMTFENVDGIVLSHVLEHFSFRDTVNVLTKLHDWLKPGGKLVVEVPNIDILLKLDTSNPGWQMGIYGAQVHDGEYHKTGFTLEDLIRYLAQCGFVIVTARTFLSENRERRGYPCIEVVALAG